MNTIISVFSTLVLCTRATVMGRPASDNDYIVNFPGSTSNSQITCQENLYNPLCLKNGNSLNTNEISRFFDSVPFNNNDEHYKYKTSDEYFRSVIEGVLRNIQDKNNYETIPRDSTECESIGTEKCTNMGENGPYKPKSSDEYFRHVIAKVLRNIQEKNDKTLPGDGVQCEYIQEGGQDIEKCA